MGFARPVSSELANAGNILSLGISLSFLPKSRSVVGNTTKIHGSESELSPNFREANSQQINFVPISVPFLTLLKRLIIVNFGCLFL